MANGNNIHDEVKEQRKKLKDLSFSGKIEYILNYYKIPIIAVILAVLFAGSLTYSIIRNNYDTVCFIAVLDGRITGYDAGRRRRGDDFRADRQRQKGTG